MAWKSISLGQILGPANIAFNKAASNMTKVIGDIQIIKQILDAFLSSALDEINTIQRLISAFEASGFYLIVLSPAKGSWSTRFRIAPNAPPEGTKQFYTCGVAVVLARASSDDTIQTFKDAIARVQQGFEGYKPIRMKNTPPNPPVATATVATFQTDIWQRKTLGDLFPTAFSAVSAISESAIGFISNLKHALATIDLVTTNATAVLDASKSYMQDLNASGCYAVFLSPQEQGIVDRLTAEFNAPPMGAQFYTVGLCACAYAASLEEAQTKYAQLKAVFDPNIDGYPDFVAPMLPTIKSWAIPKGGYYDREVYVTLNCSISSATIYYTVNGRDPRTDATRQAYVSSSPIYITKNNTVVRFYAVDGVNIERRTRQEIYRIVEIPYGVTADADTGIGQGTSIIPPQANWGTSETVAPDSNTTVCFQPGATVSGETTLIGDSGNPAGFVDTTVIPDASPLIPADDPAAAVITPIQDFDYGYKDTSIGTELLIDAGTTDMQVAVFLSGQFGSLPWGNVSKFPDVEAWWVWNSEKANLSALTNQPVVVQKVFINTLYAGLKVDLLFMADNTAMFYFNGQLMDTDTGWYSYNGATVGSWQIPDGYRKVSLTLPLGENTFSFICHNWSGYAGLIFTVIDLFTNEVYCHSDETCTCTPVDWYPANAISKQSSTNAVATNYVEVAYGQTCYVPASKSSAATIVTVMSNLSNLTVSSDGTAFEGTVDFVAPIVLQYVLNTGLTVTVTLVPIFDVTANSLDLAPTCQDQVVQAFPQVPVEIVLTATNKNATALADDTIHYFVVTLPNHGTITGVAPNLQYTAHAGYEGTDSFTFMAYNEASRSQSATVEINIAPALV